MVFKYSLTVSGDDFYPEKVISKLDSTFIVDSYFSPNDQKFSDSNEKYDYGGIFFWHPCKYSTEDKIADYEKGFIDFLEKNYKLFADSGGNTIDIYLEIYYGGDQCNFEIFSKALLNRLAVYNVSLPISVYVLKEEVLQEWEREIRDLWRKLSL